jgi:hypothetical protein
MNANAGIPLSDSKQWRKPYFIATPPPLDLRNFFSIICLPFASISPTPFPKKISDIFCESWEGRDRILGKEWQKELKTSGRRTEF